MRGPLAQTSPVCNRKKSTVAVFCELSWRLRRHSKVQDLASGVDWVVVPKQKLIQGWQSGPFWLENRLRWSRSLCGASCIDGFTAFFWTLVVTGTMMLAALFVIIRLYQLWRGNLLGCMTFSYPYRHSLPTILSLNNFLQPWWSSNKNAHLRHSWGWRV